MSHPAYSFTPDDHISPVFCIGCRTHIPRSVSNVGGGYCPPCVAQRLAQQSAQQQAMAAQQAQRQAAQQAGAGQVFRVATGMGLCPQRHSSNVGEVANHVPNASRNALSAAGCFLMIVSIFCLWPLAIAGVAIVVAGMFLPARVQTGTSRICNYCGFRWPV